MLAAHQRQNPVARSPADLVGGEYPADLVGGEYMAASFSEVSGGLQNIWDFAALVTTRRWYDSTIFCL
jgi:hypothetical protein